MPRQEGNLSINTFVGGFVSDYHELDFPQNVTTSEDNCDLDRHGNRRRRFGIDYEEDFVLSTTSFDSADLPNLYVKTSVWEAVNNNGNVNFLVVQLGSILSFYDMTKQPLSGALLSFTVDLQDHKITAGFDDVLGQYEVQCVSGKGVLFVAGVRINPFYITYDEDTDDITETDLDIRIRDIKLQSGVSDYEALPVTIDHTLKYDYFNQGWYYDKILDVDHKHYPHVLDIYYAREALTVNSGYHHYPPLSKPWWFGKVNAVHGGIADDFETFAPLVYDAVYTGNLLAPLGHYIIDPFNVDRSGVSGIPGFGIERSNDRPGPVAFYAGKVFYGWKNQIMFSQTLIDDFTVAAKCYQVADPTAQDINNLVATDGGVIPLQYSGEIVAFVPFENSLLIFCTNGIWALGGSNAGQGFSADGFAIYKVSSVGAINSRTIVDVEGVPFFWSKTGIYAVQPVPAKQGFDVVNICEKKIQFFYDDIPGVSKQYASGAYDRLKRRIVWMYNSTGTSLGNLYYGDAVLNYDTILQAFSTYSVDSNSGKAFICDVFHLYDISRETLVENVVDDADVIVTDDALENVTVDRIVYGNFSNELDIGHKFLVFGIQIDESAEVTFADFHDTTFTDWFSTDDAGEDYLSYLETFYMVPDVQKWSQFPYLFVYTENSTFGDVAWEDALTSTSAAWSNTRTYQIGSLVNFSSGMYVGKTTNNTGNTPTVAGTTANWHYVGTSSTFAAWSSGGTYAANDVVWEATQGLFMNLTGTNTATAPHSDAVNWVICADLWVAGTYGTQDEVYWPDSNVGKLWVANGIITTEPGV